MAVQQSTTLRTAQADAITTAVGNAGLLQIWSGTLPANCAAADAGTKLSEHTCGTPFAPGASSGVLSPTLPANVNALASNTAVHYRLRTSAGVCVQQGTVGTSGADMNFVTTTIVSGQPVAIATWTITMPGA